MAVGANAVGAQCVCLNDEYVPGMGIDLFTGIWRIGTRSNQDKDEGDAYRDYDNPEMLVHAEAPDDVRRCLCGLRQRVIGMVTCK